jgi:uncharacterized membrane protein HdeD (DUF308 family)
MPKIADPADPAGAQAPAGPGDPAKVRKSYRALMRAGLLEMALGVLYAIFPFAGHGSFHIFGGLAIIAGGVVVISLGLRLRNKARAADRTS